MRKSKYHFIAMGGVGQSAVAKILLEQGFEVSGSDISDGKYLKQLKEMGAKVYIGHDPENVPNNSTVVISTAIKEDNPELVRAKELGLKILHRSDMLKVLSENCSDFIGFSGTHGKTTTSGMCAYILEKCLLKPTFAIGGIVPSLNTNAKSSKDYMKAPFVAELDESDGTISKYSPDYIVINNLEADHFDFYKNGEEEVIRTFEKFCATLKENAKIFLNIDNKGNIELLKRISNKNIVTFSLKQKADYRAENIALNSCGSSFDVYKSDKKMGEVKLIIPGVHNVYNALSVISVLIERGLNFEDFKEHFFTFEGMGRRFQSVAKFNDIEIIDDYAHHPTEIKALLDAARNYGKDHRLVVVFQPHRYSRFKGLWDEFKNALKNSDLLIVTDVWSAGEDLIDGFTSEDFAQQTACIHLKGSMREVAEKMYTMLLKGDIVLTVGAGDITKLGGFLNEKSG